MAVHGALDRTKHLDEFKEPLDTQEGVLTPAARRGRALSNLANATMTAEQLAAVAGVTPGVAVANKAVVLGASKEVATLGAVTAGALSATTGAFSGALTPTGGVAAAGGFSVSPRLSHTGGMPARVSTDGADATPVNTEVYIAEIFVPANMSLTGIALFNGSAVAGNVKVGLADSAGAVVATSASVAQAGVDAYQRVPFTGAYAAKGPATYYVLVMFDTNTTPKFNTHVFGDFGAAKQTGQVYATGFIAITPPTTFITALAPIASAY